MEKIKEFIHENVDTILKTIGITGLVIFCKKFGISLNPLIDSSRPKYTTSSRSTYIYTPTNFIEEAICSIANDAINCDFDSSRKKSADQIVQILSNNKNDISNSTKSFAIIALRKISGKMDFDSSKNYISDLITKIARGDI